MTRPFSTWVRVDTDAADHPKVGRLARRVAIPPAEAFRLVFRLWSHAAEYSPRGFFATVDDIADAARYEGDAEALAEALVFVGYVDRSGGGYELHGWDKRNGKLADAREREAERLRRFRAGGKGTEHDLESAARTDRELGGEESAARTRPNLESAARTDSSQSTGEAPDSAEQPGERTPYVRRTKRQQDGVRNANRTAYATPTVGRTYGVDDNEERKDKDSLVREALSFAGHVAGARDAGGSDVDELQGYLDVLRRLYPRFGSEPRVARSLYDMRAALPSLEEFEIRVRLHVASGAWTEDRGAYVPRCDRWLLNRGWQDEPQEARGVPRGVRPGSGALASQPIDAATSAALSRLSAGAARR